MVDGQHQFFGNFPIRYRQPMSVEIDSMGLGDWRRASASCRVWMSARHLGSQPKAWIACSKAGPGVGGASAKGNAFTAAFAKPPPKDSASKPSAVCFCRVSLLPTGSLILSYCPWVRRIPTQVTSVLVHVHESASISHFSQIRNPKC